MKRMGENKMETKITKDMTIGDAVEKYPDTVKVLFEHGLHCIGCHVAKWETIEEGAKAHGVVGDKLDKMIKKMNEVAK